MFLGVSNSLSDNARIETHFKRFGEVFWCISHLCIDQVEKQMECFIPLEFAAIDRNKVQAEEVGYAESEEDFDTTIHGPWMRRWEITHHNRHTAALMGSGSFHKA